MESLKRFFTYGVVAFTIMWAMGLAAFVPVAGAATIVSGDLIKASMAAVYYYGADGKRYVFPNEKTYKTWYSDFSTVKTITDSELAAIPIGGNVTYKPGVKMIKITTDPKVYAVAANGTLRWVQTEAIAESLYGTAWNTMIDDVSDAFFTNYTIGTDVTAVGDYSSTSAQAAATSINVDKGIGTGGTGGALTVALASDSPAAQSVPGGALAPASNVVFAKINLTAGSQAATVSKVRITRTGLSSDADLANVRLWSGATQLDTAQTLNSSHQALFNVNKTIAANSTLSLTVTGDLAITAGAASAEFRLGISANTDVISNASSTSGAPVWGSTMTAVNTNVGSLTIAQGAAMPAGGSTVDLNETETFFGMRLTAGSVENVSVRKITLQSGNNSTINAGDVEQIKLINDTTGETLATLEALSDTGDAIFDLTANPIQLSKGNTRELKLDATVVDGAGRVIAFDVSDGVSFLIDAVGATYGYGVSLIDGAGWTTATTGVGVGVNVNQGIVTVSKATTTPAAGSIAIGGTDLNVAEYSFELQGEDVRFGTTSVDLVFASTAGATACSQLFDNVQLVDGQGDVLAGPVTPTLSAGNYVAGTCTANFTSSFELPNGTNTVGVNLNTPSTIAANDTVQAQMNVPAFTNVRGLTSNRTLTIGGGQLNPNALVLANTQTVKGPILVAEMGSVPVVAQVVVGKSAFTVAYIGLDASAGGEDVRVQNMTLTNTGSTTNAEWINAKLFNVATGLQVGTTKQPTANAVSFTFSGDEVLAMQSAQVTLALQIDILSTATVPRNFRFNATALAGTGKQSSTAAGVTLPAAPSPLQTLAAAGSLKVNLDADLAIGAQLVQNSTGNAAVSYKLEGINEPIDVTEIYIAAADPTALAAPAPRFAGDVLSFDIYVDGVKKGGTLNASATGVHLLSLATPITVPKDDYVIVTVKMALQGKANITSGDLFRIGIADGAGANGAALGTAWGAAGSYEITATGKDSGTAIAANINSTGAALGTIAGGNTMSAHDGVLTVSLNAGSPSGLKTPNAAQEVLKLDLTATGDEITFGAIDLVYTHTGGALTVAAPVNMYLSTDNTTVYAATGNVTQAAGSYNVTATRTANTLSVGAGSTKTAVFKHNTTGKANPDSVQVVVDNHTRTANGLAWYASDKRVIDASAAGFAAIFVVDAATIDPTPAGLWTGPTTKNLPVYGGAISY